MVLRLLIISILLTIQFNSAYSQSEINEPISDSIVYIPETVIIKQTYYLPKNKRIRKDTLGWYIGGSYQYGKDNFSSSTIYNNISTVSASIGKKNKNLYTEVGIGFMYMNAKYSNSIQTTKQKTTNREVIDTIDTYYQQIGGVEVPVYVTQTKTVTDVKNYQSDSLYANQIKLSYLQIPINFTYLFSIKKFKIGPQIGIKPCFLITDLTMYSNYDVHSFLMYGSAGINIGYQFTKKMLLIADINEQFTFQESSMEAIGTMPFQNIGISVKYLF
jgi:hypothetical protein